MDDGRNKQNAIGKQSVYYENLYERDRDVRWCFNYYLIIPPTTKKFFNNEAICYLFIVNASSVVFDYAWNLCLITFDRKLQNFYLKLYFKFVLISNNEASIKEIFKFISVDSKLNLTLIIFDAINSVLFVFFLFNIYNFNS